MSAALLCSECSEPLPPQTTRGTRALTHPGVCATRRASRLRREKRAAAKDPRALPPPGPAERRVIRETSIRDPREGERALGARTRVAYGDGALDELIEGDSPGVSVGSRPAPLGPRRPTRKALSKTIHAEGDLDEAEAWLAAHAHLL